MVALDTNVLVRFLVRDDAKQAESVRAFFVQAQANRQRLFVSLLVLMETIWVLESAYECSRADILAAIGDMRQMNILFFEADEAVEGLLRDGMQYKADLSDILIAHAAQVAGCAGGITFDKAAAKLSFFTLLK